MIIYITGASGSGKTHLLQSLPSRVKGIDLDDLYEANWKKHRLTKTVHKGVKGDIEALMVKYTNLVFVGLQMKADLPFTPDYVILLVRKDYESFYRQKLIRDLKLLCEDQEEYSKILSKKPIEDFRNYFWSNDIVNMKTLEEFKAFVEKINGAIQKDFPEAIELSADEVLTFLKSRLKLIH